MAIQRNNMNTKNYYKTHNDDKNINANATCLQGEVETSYKKLVNLFGKPTTGDGYKVDAEWSIEFSDGVVATIYNWKDGKNYNGGCGLDVEEITNWHIGGHNERAVINVLAIINQK